MPTHFVYILQSRDGRYYIGYTTDLKRRMAAHKNGTGAKFTRAFGFKKLLYSEKHPSKSAALKREAALKKLSRFEKHALITL
jgi:putative endonuclease